jgi:hypothetical protein
MTVRSIPSGFALLDLGIALKGGTALRKVSNGAAHGSRAVL